jgi:hypothetical protein
MHGKNTKKLHLAEPSREYYIFHTDHKTIKFKEQKLLELGDDFNED